MNEKPQNRSVEVEGVKIRKLRQAKGWSVEELAEKSISSVKTISRLEAGARAYPTTLGRIAKALAVDTSLLIKQPAEAGEKRNNVVSIILSVKFKEADETELLNRLLGKLRQLIGDDDMDIESVTGGSTVVTLRMSEKQVHYLSQALWEGKLQGYLVLEGTMIDGHAVRASSAQAGPPHFPDPLIADCVVNPKKNAKHISDGTFDFQFGDAPNAEQVSVIGRIKRQVVALAARDIPELVEEDGEHAEAK